MLARGARGARSPALGRNVSTNTLEIRGLDALLAVQERHNACQRRHIEDKGAKGIFDDMLRPRIKLLFSSRSVYFDDVIYCIVHGS